ncbi:MAG: tyrosine-protein phosphatase [Actinomycetota bacterium]|nr:tyrosine-protein phosphatase [Actinomycetota bacterium]
MTTTVCEIEGCFNFRDAGGWPAAGGTTMRNGVLYRADAPERLTAAGRATVATLGLTCVIDLRQKRFVEMSLGFAGDDVTHHIELVDQMIDYNQPPRLEEPVDLTIMYTDLIGRCRPQLVHAIGVVADHVQRGPVLVHCTAGKDRTGLVVALIQAAIGVPLESIADDFARSDDPSRRRRAAMLESPVTGDPPVARSPEFMWTAPREAMRLLAVEAVDEFGSLESWPRQLGVSEAAIERLQTGLLS